jgi:response regulator RpfG family c-di-GMP phosphodiesterase
LRLSRLFVVFAKRVVMASKPRVLCVDDEPSVLEGLSLTLRRGYEVVTAQSGAAALDLLGRDPAIAVVLSDMRMPGMDGATFLGKARLVAPDATRLLLTGQADLASAIAAINEGRIFRFLNKPCSPPMLVAAIEAAVDMNRLVTAERVLLEQTLRASIQMLMDVLALAAPTTFGQAVRIQRHARELASKVAGAEIWPVEVAAMLSQVGFITLAPATVEKLQEGKPLAQEEQLALDRLPAFAERLVSGIPRLEVVRAALKHLGTRYDGAGEAAAHAPHGKAIPLGARVLAVVCDYDRLEAGGASSQLALDTLRGRRGRYDPELLDLFAANLGTERRDDDVSEIPIRNLRVGMVLLDDVRTTAGRLLVARGHEATASLVERFRNFAPGFVAEPVRVSLKRLTGSTS